MCQCQQCGTPSVPNTFEDISFDQIASGTLAAKRAGHPAHAVSALVTWVGVEALNYFRPAWRCPACDHRFD